MNGPTPADVPAGHVVKIRSRGQTWTSPVMAPTEAARLAQSVEKSALAAGGGGAFIGFDCGDGRHLVVRGREILSVETGPATEASRGGSSSEPTRETTINVTVPDTVTPADVAHRLRLASQSPDRIADRVVRW